MDDRIRKVLTEAGAEMVRFVDIASLPADQTQGFKSAVVFCMPLSKEFVLATRDGRPTERDEFSDKEREADELADKLAEYIRQNGYNAYSQSEKSNGENGNYDRKTRTSRLPHKTIARLSGIGFIGKNNLFVTEEYGCAFAMCTVLMDAPVRMERTPLVSPGCGRCDVCKSACPVGAIYGAEWSESGGRDAVVDVFKCVCPLKCMVNCPYTLKYALRSDGAG